MVAFEEITGRKYGKFTVVAVHERRTERSVWRCRCECGAERLTQMRTLIDGLKCKVCDEHHLRTHGMTRTSPEFRAWSSAWDRCRNPKHPAWSNYGGRGLTVCDEWRDFQAFYKELGPRPAGMSLDRIDNSLGYEPGNCRWATRADQANNRRVTRMITIDGRTKSLSQWCEETGVPVTRALGRMKHGWPEAEAVTDAADRRRTRRTSE